MKIELRGRHRRRELEDSSDNLDYIARESSRGSGSHRSRDKFRETIGRYQEFPHRKRSGHHNAAMDAMSWALRKAARSLFLNEIKRTKIPRRFT